jgi:hypothetical protein
MLLVYHAEPDSPSAHGLALLGGLADHRKTPQRRAPTQGSRMP